jgi:hypothetical protein
MDNKKLALLRVTDPDQYNAVMAHRKKLEANKYPPLESNRIGPWSDKLQDFTFVARMYGGLHQGQQRVVEADGSHYKGTITRRKVSRPRLDGSGNFWQTFYELGDGRWFDNSGILCEKPKSKIASPEEESTDD